MSKSITELARDFDQQLAVAASRHPVPKRASGPSKYITKSYQAGVPPNWVAKANERCRLMDLRGVEYHPDGAAHYAGPKARERHLKSLGLVDYGPTRD